MIVAGLRVRRAVASKPRVHELAKELGVSSKEVLGKLQDIGEFVKSASSTVETPVARKLRALYGVEEKSTEEVNLPSSSGKDKTGATDKVSQKSAETDNKVTGKSTAKADIPKSSTTVPSPSNIPKPAAPKVPRMGNNPFSSQAPARNESPSPRTMPTRRQSPKPDSNNGHPGRGGNSGGFNNKPRFNKPKGAESTGGEGVYKTAKNTTPNVPNSTGPGGYKGKGPVRGKGSTAGAFGRPGGVGNRKNKKSKRQKQQEQEAIQAPVIGGVTLPNGGGKVIKLARGASLGDLAEKIDASPSALVQALFSLGEMVTATQSVSDDTLELLGSEMNFVIKVVSPEDEDKELLESFDLTYGEDTGSEKDLKNRPPVVTIMGHVDHGKTRLLDSIRKSNVSGHESGGITQHIGAYQVQVNYENEPRTITFIDTPGHEAFTAMRARGAQSTDIAILVVAADDGVMPQTVEALNHAQAANVPIVVAVNKIDKPEANPAKIRNQLTEYGLIAEEYGGQTQFVDISAREGLNIDKLMEAVLLTADAELDLRANPDMPAQGVAIEAHLDKGRGPIATVIIQRGTLRVGDSIVAGGSFGRVRRMIDENGKSLDSALPSRPVQVVGFTTVPSAGDTFIVVDDDRTARQIADRRATRKRNAIAAKSVKKVSLEDLESVLKETNTLNLILKADNSGTVEALEEALMGIKVDDEVDLQIIDRGVGGVTETNVNLAAASDAIIIGFKVRAEGKATEVANREGVEIRYYSVIYQAIDEIEQALKGMLKPIYEEKELGTAEIRALFKSSKVGTIAGCLITSGSITRGAKARLLRDNKVVADNLTISSLRREKDDVNEVKNGYECGLTLTYTDIKVGDTIMAYDMVEIPRD